MPPEKGDFVEVIKEGHVCEGLIGKVERINKDKLIVNIFGKDIKLNLLDIKIRAKVDTRAHSLLERKASLWEMPHLDKVGLSVLMDIALWLRDFEWCGDIWERMQVAPDNIEKDTVKAR